MDTYVHSRPTWYTDEDDTAWSKVREAFRRDWMQTKHDFGGNEPDLNQQVGDTVSQAAGRSPIPAPNQKTPHPRSDSYRDEDESAYKYGYAASRHLGTEWDEDALRKDWGDSSDWDHQREAVRRGWAYGRYLEDSRK